MNLCDKRYLAEKLKSLFICFPKKDCHSQGSCQDQVASIALSPRGKSKEPLIGGTEMMRMAKWKTSRVIRIFHIALICYLDIFVFLPLICAQGRENAEAHFRRAKKLFEEGSLEGAEREYHLAL